MVIECHVVRGESVYRLSYDLVYRDFGDIRNQTKVKKGRGQRKNKRDVEGRRRNALKVLLDKKLC